MIKKILSTSAATALMFAACSTDDPVAPLPVPVSSSSIQSNLSSVSDIIPSSESNAILSSESIASSSSEMVKKDTTFLNPDDNEIQSFTKNECSVKTNAADNSILLEMTYAGEVKSIITMTLEGSMVNIESKAIYDAKISDTMVKKFCEDAKKEALLEDATVICEKRSVTAVMTKPTNGQTLKEVSESSQQTCDSFNNSFKITDPVQSSSSALVVLPESSSSALTNPPKIEKSRATCEITKDTDEAFNMVITAPDSVTMTIEATYNNNIFSMNGVVVFAPNVPQSVIDKECAKEKAEAAEDDDGTVVICSGNVITESHSFMVTENLLILAAPSLVEECDKVQETGVIPEDDEL